MIRIVRPLAVFSIASAASIAVALQLGAGGAHGSDGRPAFGIGDLVGHRHDLSRLRLIERTLYHVDETYVEPSRIDWEAMYVEALEAVERAVPAVMFTRQSGGTILSVEIGSHRDVLEIDPIDTRRRLVEELRAVALMLEEHLLPRDIPVDPPGIDPMAHLEYVMANGILSTLDPHSVLLPPPDASEMDAENQGEFGGLGITIVERDNRLTVEYPLPGTPAMEAGLRPDDQIVRIDGESTINMSLDEAVRLLRGPVGEAVQLHVVRGNEREPLAFEIVRRPIRPNRVEGELLEGDIGYVRIKSFHQKVEAEMLDELAKLHRRTVGGQLRGLVLDLRENPGGYLNQAVRVADAFLDEGTIVSTLDGSGQKREEERAHAGTEPNYPIAVLVDASSASASEIVAGALRNNNRAVIIGERTFGKGSVQNLHDLDDSKLKITISKYLTPGDRSIQSIGIPADIELNAGLLARASDSGPSEDVALLYWRERVHREADLDKHLEQVALRVEEPVYRVPYLRDWPGRRQVGRVDPQQDFEVRFARDVLLAAPSHRRSETLAAIGGVVQRGRDKGERAIVEAFRAFDVDWSDGPAWPRGGDVLPVSIRLDLGQDDLLTAGEPETIAVEVTNTSDRPLYRVAAIATGNDILEGREFFFGRLEPGQTRRWEQKISLTDGYPSERAPVIFELRDSGEGALGEHVSKLAVAGRPLPRFEWSWTLDDGQGGNGNGLAEVGEEIELRLTVRNVGNGPTSDAFARIRNRSRRALDIVHGTVMPGFVVDADGEPCEPEQPGVEAGTIYGDPDHERVLAGREPLWPEHCSRVLEPGQSWTGSFRVALREAPDRAYALELALGDHSAYDWASVVRAGFGEYYLQNETLAFAPGVALPSGPTRRPPVVHVTRAPSLVVDAPRVTVSGLVEDDTGVEHVMVFAGNDKVFYQGSGPASTVRAVPWTADVALQPGMNTITVLTTDVDGFTHTASVVTYWSQPELAAREH